MQVLQLVGKKTSSMVRPQPQTQHNRRENIPIAWSFMADSTDLFFRQSTLQPKIEIFLFVFSEISE